MARVIPQQVVSRAEASGAAGTEWLANLDNLISSLEEQWRITVGDSLSGGSHAFAAYASGEDEKEYVLKSICLTARDTRIFPMPSKR